MPLTYDIHAHFAPLGRHAATDRFLRQPNRYVRMFLRQLDLPVETLGIPDADAMLRRRFLEWVSHCGIDRVVVLALDAAHDVSGEPCPEDRAFVVDNEFVAELCSAHPALLFGASVHPYRRDAVACLERLIARGACMVKWIPSAQQIRLDDPRCTPVYDLLAAHRVPLLVHTGNEHATSRTRNSWNDPALLSHALDRGVTVIAAHCGARMWMHERCFFSTFCRMALEHDRLFGDISAFGIPTRIPMLRTLRRTPDLMSKVLYGSDFPATEWARWFVFMIGARAVREVLQERNPLRRPYLLMRHVGLPETVFTRAGELLGSRHHHGPAA